MHLQVFVESKNRDKMSKRFRSKDIDDDNIKLLPEIWHTIKVLIYGFDLLDNSWNNKKAKIYKELGWKDYWARDYKEILIEKKADYCTIVRIDTTGFKIQSITKINIFDLPFDKYNKFL